MAVTLRLGRLLLHLELHQVEVVDVVEGQRAAGQLAAQGQFRRHVSSPCDDWRPHSQSDAIDERVERTRRVGSSLLQHLPAAARLFVFVCFKVHIKILGREVRKKVLTFTRCLCVSNTQLYTTTNRKNVADDCTRTECVKYRQRGGSVLSQHRLAAVQYFMFTSKY